MNTLPSSGEIEKILLTSVVGKQIQDRTAEVLSDDSQSAWYVNFIANGTAAEQVFMLENGGKKFILKTGKKRKLWLDAETEEAINAMKTGVAPTVIQKGENRGVCEEPYYWILQEFISGVELPSYCQRQTLSEELQSQLVEHIGNIHQVRPNYDPFFGKILATESHRNKDFNRAIDRLVEYVARSPCFSEEQIQRMKKALEFLKKKIEGENMQPCLIHGDLQGRNIMIQDENNLRIIDFGDAQWGTPEMEFSIMLAHRWSLDDLDMYRNIKEKYESKFGPLHPDIFDICCIAYTAFKNVRRFERKTSDGGVWDKVIAPILAKVETNYKV